jgi:hypothetical protein
VLLAVDVPSVAGGEQRIFVEGGPTLYERGGVLDVLRDPFIRVGGLWERALHICMRAVVAGQQGKGGWASC